MFNFNYELSQDDKDKIRLSVAQLLFLNTLVDMEKGGCVGFEFSQRRYDNEKRYEKELKGDDENA